jgi:uncharacterized protein (TIGR02687 family)
MSKIQQSIASLLQEHRILIWFDAEKAFTEVYEALELSDTKKLTVNGNEFETKVRVLHQEPKQKFILYLPKEKPKNEENWLLDIELAHHVYHTDQEALYLQEVGLGYHYKDWIRNHILFFKNKERVAAFTKIAKEEDGDYLLTLKLLQVIFGAKTISFNEILRVYSTAFATDSQDSIERDLDRFNLKDFFWDEVKKRYGYSHNDPTIYDFLLETFQKNFTPLKEKSSVNRETEVMLSNWKDTLSFQPHFKQISKRVEDDLHIEEVLNQVDVTEIVDDDLFEIIDKRIISALVTGILSGSLDEQRFYRILKKRESKYWYERYQSFYQSLELGFRLLDKIERLDKILISSFEEGIENYIRDWYQIDQQYRTFIEYYRETKQNNVLSPFYHEVNKAYTNNWLLNLSDAWQNVIDKENGWASTYQLQTYFFNHHVKPFIQEKTRLFVIISDALRYECGVDFHQLIQKENRFDSSLDYQITPLPSYTQLGMASLLPHQQISFSEKDLIQIDGKSTSGKSGREKILKENSGVQATAVRAEVLMKMASRSEEARELVTNHDLIYVYHNRIDKLGDDKSSEEKVIEAARDEIQFLVDLTKKVANLGGYNILVTADHGFIYQNEPIAESDFSEADISGEVLKTNRRFVLGRDLSQPENMLKFHASDFGIQGEMEMLIPKSINRLRVHGAGSRFVHGGATLQEIVVPIIKINKKREDTVSKVDVDVLNKRSNKITTNIQRVSFYQLQPIAEKRLARTLKIQFKSETGEALSDVFTYTFNSNSDRSKDREIDYQFKLSRRASDQFKHQTVYLTLEEAVEGSNKWITYQKFPYTINISFTSDFDDF